MTTAQQLVAAHAEWQRIFNSMPLHTIDHAKMKQLDAVERRIQKLRKSSK